MVAEGGQPPRRLRTMSLTRLPTIIRRPPTITRQLPKWNTGGRQYRMQAATNLYHGGRQYRTQAVATFTMAAASLESWQSHLL